MKAVDAEWAPLAGEMSRWRDAGRKPVFWLRDDDAIEPTPALDRLMRLGADFDVPILLAVIPASTGEALATRLSREEQVTVAVHGYAHLNHAPAGEKKCELGQHRPAAAVIRQLSDGVAKLRRLHGRKLLPVLVPPWNRIDEGLIPLLPPAGFQAISVFGPAKPWPLAVINANVDIIDWHGSRGCLPTPILVDNTVAQLRRAFDSGDPVGILTHHLVHDDAAWAFLARLFEITTSAGADWTAIDGLIARRPG